MQPYLCGLRPGGYWELGGAEAVAVAAFGVDVQLGGDFCFLELEEIDDGVFDMDRVVFGLDDEGGRGVGGGVDVGVGREVFVGEREIAGIDDEREVGTAAELVGGVDRVVQALVVVSADGCGKMGAGGEAEDADSLGIDVPFGGVLADDAHGALGVLERGVGLGVGAGAGDAVLHAARR